MAICKDKPATTTEAFKAMERTIAKISHFYARNHYQDFDDLFSNGCIGLMKAWDQFDPEAGCAFSSYAYNKILAEVRSTAKGNWEIYNHTSGMEITDAMGDASYDIDNDSAIDLSRKIEAQDEVTQQIIAARLEGYNFREIAEGLTKLGHPHTLHQARNKYMAAMEN